jgi:hypothetical protein
MRIAFSDEAGTGDETQEPILVVAATLIDPDLQWNPIKSKVDSILANHVPAGQRAEFEFKAARLYAQLSKNKNEALLREFLGIIPTFQLPIFWGAINRKGMRDNYATMKLSCSTDDMQNAGFIIAAIMAEAFIGQWFPDERVLWIADETRARIPMRMSLREYQKRALIPDEQTTKFDHIIDTVFYGSSRESTGIQLADACNFFIKRHHMGDRSAERFFKIIYPYMARRDWKPLYSPDDDSRDN